MHASREILVFDREGVRAIDHAAVAEYGIPGVVLMENAAIGLCSHALEMLRRGDAHNAPTALIICGSGNNGGDGYALARHLHNHRISVVIAAIGMPKPETDAGINRAICERMRLPIIDSPELGPTRFAATDLIVDAIFGTGLDRAIDAGSEAARAIALMNACGKPVLAVDVPSGLNCETGRPFSPDGVCVKATRTVTFVGLKVGFLHSDALAWLGETEVCDIGAPRELSERFGRLQRIDRG